MTPLLTPKEVAAYLHLHPNTLRRIPAGDLPYYVISRRGDRRYRLEALTEYLAAKSRWR